MSDKYGYIAIETLLNYCKNTKDNAITPNDFMRMKRADVVERKRGYWIDTSEVSYGILFKKYTCSNCQSVVEERRTNFCPYCGAHMEERKGDEYDLAIEQLQHDMTFEPTFNPEDGSM